MTDITLRTISPCSCGSCELGEIVGGADQRPFGLHFVDAAQQELPEPPCLLDLSEYRLDDLLAEPVAAAPARPLQLVAHGLRQGPGDVASAFGRVLGASGGEVGDD